MRANQTGSIVGFVIVGGLLALLLVGGAYFVRHNLSPVSDGIPASSPEDTNDIEEQPANHGSNTTNEENEQAGGDVDVSLPGRTDSETQPEPSHDTPAGLPETGPSSALLSGILLGGIAAAGVAYKRSRDLLRITLTY